MTSTAADDDHLDTSPRAPETVTIDPSVFYQYAATCAEHWQELVGSTITHCVYGPGTIVKIEGEYISVDLPQRQGKKQLTEFGLSAFQRGYFRNLRIDPVLQEKIQAAGRAADQEAAPSEGELTAPPAAPPKRKRAPGKSKKKPSE